MSDAKFVCRGCGSEALRLFLDLGAQPHCNRLIPVQLQATAEPKFPLRVYFCDSCTLVQIDHTIPKESMFTNYPYVSGTTATLVEHFRESAERLTATHGLRPGSLVVDIGSNDGTWLRHYKPFGLRVLGIDPAENVVELAIANGVPTWARFFNEQTAEEILAKEGPASLVTAAGVFFHLEELHSVVRGIKRLIADGGVFVVQAIYLGAMLEQVAFDQVYHEHLVYYTLKSLSHLLAQHGLEVFDARIVPIHGGTIEAHVGLPGRRPITQSVHDLAEAERRKAYDKFETYESFVRKVQELKQGLLALLEQYQIAGKTVYALGAPAKGATLLNSFGITTKLVQKATERNRMKIGFLMPGSRIPIVDEEGANPDAYLVLAWNFIDEIVRRQQDYLAKGGKFIVPIPELKVVEGAAR